VDDHAAAAMALIENIQREDLNPLEEAQGIQRLISDFGFTHEQAAGAVGRSRSAVSNLLRLLNLAQPVQTMLMAGDIDMGHARALLSVDAATQINLANMIIARRLSVREAEKLVAQALAEDQQQKPAPREKPRDIVRLEEELSDALATQVAIKVSARNKGQLVIDFANLDALDGVIARLRR
jgi:ParB family chromosome partitioning protein